MLSSREGSRWYPINGRLSALQNRFGDFGGEINPLSLAGNRTTIPRSSSPQPSQYTNRATTTSAVVSVQFILKIWVKNA
jgi:hypothetical protein